MKLILGRIFAIWAALCFCLTLLLILPFVIATNYIKEPKKSNIFYKLSKIWMQSFLTLVGCPLKVVGKENFKPNQNYVVVSNHNSFLDPPVTCPFVPGANRTIAKKEFMKIPFFNQIYKRGSVLVDRKSAASRAQSFKDMKQVLLNGWHMCIYAEGTRNSSSEPLQTFKDGAFKLAIESEKDIIPCLVFNTKKALPINPSFCFYPKKLHIHFLPAVSSVNETAESLKEKVFIIMKNYYVLNENKV